MEFIQIETQTEERLPWHKPQVAHLTVALDTRSAQGSGPDGLDQTIGSPA
jgi:hypothetical protein